MQTLTINNDEVYKFTVYDDTEALQVSAYEDATHKGSSKIAVAGSGFDISLSSAAAGGATDYAFLG